MKSVLLSTAAILALATSLAQARDLKTVGVTVGTLGNPFFIALAEGATAAAKKVNPDVKTRPTTTSGSNRRSSTTSSRRASTSSSSTPSTPMRSARR